MAATSTTSVKLDDETKRRVHELAKTRRRSTHWAWADYQATGMHVTADEADAWLARLESGEDAEPPACHD